MWHKRTMKLFLLTLLTLVIFSCSQQLQPTTELQPPFANQGEQENYWAQEFFKKEYEKSEYPAYEGTIIVTSHRILFGDQYIEYSARNSDLGLIFKKGLIHPNLFGLDNLQIGDLEELTLLSNDPSIRRFRLTHFDRTVLDTKLANPQVYLFELENENVEGEETLAEFIENAKLTFLKAGWVMI